MAGIILDQVDPFFVAATLTALMRASSASAPSLTASAARPRTGSCKSHVIMILSDSIPMVRTLISI